MTRHLAVFILLVFGGLKLEAAAPQSEFVIGLDCYYEGEFKQAVRHLRLALRTDPNDAEAYYLVGRSYASLADIAFPFSAKYAAKARRNLMRAVELAPERLDYRRELFNLLLDSAGASGMGLRQAAELLSGVSQDDPDYESMRRQLAMQREESASAEVRLGKVLLAVPQAAFRLGEWKPGL